MYGKNQWRGREVEGRYSDMMTWFIRSLNQDKGLDVSITDYPHYYFTIEYMNQVFLTDYAVIPELEIIRTILDSTNNVVTIEANKHTLEELAPDLVNRCHIIYRIQDIALQKLKDTDTLSIDAGWYRVHQIMKCNMMEMTPDNYKFDEQS